MPTIKSWTDIVHFVRHGGMRESVCGTMKLAANAREYSGYLPFGTRNDVTCKRCLKAA